MATRRITIAVLLLAAPLAAQTTNDPFPQPIEATRDVIVVNYVEFATIPDSDESPPRMMTLVDEPGTRRMFVTDMRGPIHSISYDGQTVTPFLDIDDPTWGVGVQSMGNERGVQSIAFHPQFAERGAPGYGKFYTWLDTRNTGPEPDFRPAGGDHTHDTVLLEWTMNDAAAATYDGGPPREVLRIEQPFGNHNAGHIAFRPQAEPGDADYGLLYIGVADGGSGGDPLDMSENLSSIFGKIIRIDPLGNDSANGEYGIPADNPFAGDEDAATLGEIYVYGVRNPQRFAWDPVTGNAFLADIGQNTVEELSIFTRGANLGWNTWEGSFRYVGREGVDTRDPRSDPSVTYPVAEYDQQDALLQNNSAITGVQIFRDGPVPALEGLVVFGDNPSGELFYIRADDLPNGGQDGIRRILLNDGGEAKTLLQLIQEKNREQGREPATRADLRFGAGPEGQLLLLNKRDGIIRLIVP